MPRPGCVLANWARHLRAIFLPVATGAQIDHIGPDFTETQTDHFRAEPSRPPAGWDDSLEGLPTANQAANEWAAAD